VQVYFDELVRYAEMDTLATCEPATRAAHSNHAITPAGTRHQSRTSTTPEPEVEASPTDLSMRRDRSNMGDGTFTSPSSGFDSPSMHAAGGSSGVAAVDGTAVSGCSDNSAAAEADRSESYVVSPSSPRADAASPSSQHNDKRVS